MCFLYVVLDHYSYLSHDTPRRNIPDMCSQKLFDKEIRYQRSHTVIIFFVMFTFLIKGCPLVAASNSVAKRGERRQKVLLLFDHLRGI